MSLEAFYHTLTTSASVWGSPRYTATTEAAGAGAAARDSGVYINLNFSARDKAGLFSFLPIPDAYLSDATCSKIAQIYRGCAPTDSKRGHCTACGVRKRSPHGCTILMNQHGTG